MKRIAALFLVVIIGSLCLTFTTFSSNLSEEENEEEITYLLSNYTGNIKEYISFLKKYCFRKYYNDETAGARYDWIEEDFLNREVCRAYNLLPHSYLAGYISKETGEVTIYGLKWKAYLESNEPAAIYDFTNVDRNHFVIPDEIDGHPVTEIGKFAFDPDGDASYLNCVTIGKNIRKMSTAFNFQENLTTMIILSKSVITDTFVPDLSVVYCYSDSKAKETSTKYGYTCCLIDGDRLLWDGEAVEGNVLYLDRGMTEAQLRAHLSIDGDSSEIQIEGLKDGKVVNGTTVTLFHKIAQAPGKVYTVEKEPEIVSVSVETLPKTNYFYKETFDPDGLSLRVTYDDGTEKSVTDGYTLSGTELKLGTNTVTATYENVSTTFPVTVRYAWWQHLIRIFLFGFLWY